jgi:hypothetical protein
MAALSRGEAEVRKASSCGAVRGSRQGSLGAVGAAQRRPDFQ